MQGPAPVNLPDLEAILAAPKSPTKGEGVMKGQMLETPVRIISVRRAP